MARYFRLPFATSGDRATLEDTTANSQVSYDTGYTMDYQLDPETANDARLIERTLFNQLMFDVTSTLQLIYQTGTPPFITSANNGGSAFSYPQYSRVLFNNRVYESLVASNTTEPSNTTNWRPVDFTGMDAIYSLRANNLSDLSNIGAARTNLGLGTAARSDTGTGASNLPTTAQADARYLQESNNLSDLDSAATARTNLGNVQTRTESDARYLLESNNLDDLEDVAEARTNLGLGTAGLYNAFTGNRDLAVVPVGLISQWHNTAIPPDDWVVARGQSTAVMSQQIKDIYGTTLPNLSSESTNTESILHTGPLISDFYMPLRDNLDIVSGTGSATFTRSTTATYVDRFGVLRSAAINEPRFEREGVLIEGSSTNQAIYQTGTSHIIVQGSSSATVENGDGFSGFPSYILTSTAEEGSGGNGWIGRTAVNGKIGQQQTVSLWVRNISAVGRSLTISWGGSSRVSDTTIPSSLEGWVRIYSTHSIIISEDSIIRIYGISRWGLNEQIEVAALQAEALPFASSYIPTAGAAVTRSGDNLLVPSSGNLVNTDQTISLTVDHSSHPPGETFQYLFYNRNSNIEWFSRLDDMNNPYVFRSSAERLDITEERINNVTQVYTHVMSTTGATLYRNGVNVGTRSGNAVGATINPNMAIGSRDNGNGPIFGHARDVRIWRRALTSTEIPR